MSLITEPKRREVFKVVAAYLIVARLARYAALMEKMELPK